MGKLKKAAKRYLHYTLNSIYYFAYYRIPLFKKLVFIESRDGKDFAGNMLRISVELSTGKFGKFYQVVRVNKAILPRARKLRDAYQLKRVLFVTKRSLALFLMECASYLFTDSGLPKKYVKREGQLLVNTWHGIPLKHMGVKSLSERHAIGTVQHLFLSCDYFLMPNEYMEKVMLEDYGINNIMPGFVLRAGYPRNQVFFDAQRAKEIREVLGCQDKKVYAYMPTWRGQMGGSNSKEQAEEFATILAEIDVRLNEDQVVYAKPHPFIGNKIDYAQFMRIRPFPESYETYDVLNACDCLITDYSSVLFDFAVSRKKIILFAYDEEQYYSERGMYLSLSEFPFPVVKDFHSLIEEMDSPKLYDDDCFVEKYCPYESKDSAERLCAQLFLKQKEYEKFNCTNGKENVLIAGGGLSKNGITSALVNLLSAIDHEKKNYVLTFCRWSVSSDLGRLDVIPEWLPYVPLMSKKVCTLREHFAYKKYAKQRSADAEYSPLLSRLFKREIKRYFGNLHFDDVVHFDGYNKDTLLLFEQFDCRRTVFVHNDMIREIEVRDIQHLPTLHRIYRDFDNVAVVSKYLFTPTSKISGRSDNISLVNNILDYKTISDKAKLPIEFQSNTEMRTWNPGGIESVIRSQGPIFVTVGRFSPEKGHKQLIMAFNEFWLSHPSASLILIGGHGPLFNRMISLAASLPCGNNVSFIKSIANPFPIVSACNCFVLSSFHEGLPMVIKEADTLGLPVIATDIPGVAEYMRENGGYVAECSENGLLQGMLDYLDGKVPVMNIDFESANREALQEFISLFE